MSLPFSPGLIRGSSSWVRKTTDTAEAQTGLLYFVMPNATSDAAPSVMTFISGHAYAQASSNTTGADLRLAPGIGRRFITVDDYAQAGTGTVTVTVNGTATVLTAGTDFTAATSNAVTATNLATAIEAIAGVSATASSAVVYVTPDDSTYTLTLARSVAAFATVTSGTDGTVSVALGNLSLPSASQLLWSTDTGLKRASAGVVQVTDGSTGSGTLYVTQGAISSPALASAGAASTGMWFVDATPSVHISANSSEVFRGSGGQAIIPVAIITAGSGTGVTVNTVGAIRTLVYKVTVTYAALAAAGLTADKTIATLPAKTRVVGIVADTTTPYTGGGVTAATLIVGKTVGGNEYIVSHDVLSAAVTKGNADADLGTSINRANAVQGGDLPSWSATTAVSVRLTTVTANTDQLTAGSTTFYLTTEAMP